MLEVLQAMGLGIGTAFTALLAWGLRRARKADLTGTESRPSISVLVAARNEEQVLPDCLESLASQDYPPELCEFIIIDDGSSDRTADIVSRRAASDRRFRLLTLEDLPVLKIGPKKRALTAGLAICRGEVVMITDADSTMGPEWLTHMGGRFAEGVSAVCGPIHYRHTQTFHARLASLEAQFNAVLNASVIGLGRTLSCSGANFAYRKAAFQDVGGFDSGGKSLSGDDDLLLQRFHAAGMKIRYCFSPQARVETDPPADARAYWLRRRRHLSAGKRYAAHWIFLAGVIWIGCFTTLLQVALALAGLHVGPGFLAWWGAFSLSLILVFHLGIKMLGEKDRLLWTLSAAILFPMYFALVHPLTLLTSPAWKGRNGSSSRAKHAA